MKTIEQLLELSKNPYYKMSKDEQAVLDDFLSKKREERGNSSQNPNAKSSGSNSPVTVRNIVPKTVDRVEDAPEPTDVS